jgi:hypothetical protein
MSSEIDYNYTFKENMCFSLGRDISYGLDSEWMLRCLSNKKKDILEQFREGMKLKVNLAFTDCYIISVRIYEITWIDHYCGYIRA